MHFLSVSNLKPGMIIARDIISSNHSFMLLKGVSLTESYIEYMQTKGYVGAYISEPGTDDIQPEEPISSKTFLEGVEAVESGNIGQLMDTAAKVVAEVSALKRLSVDLLDLRSFDDYTYHHSVNVAVYAVAVGKYMGLDDSDLVLLCQAGICHDLGKSRISLNLINKPGKLSDEEFLEIKNHPKYSYEILQGNASMSSVVRQAVLFHHENENGSGYPMGKEGKDIPIFAKIIHAVDVYDALTTQRPYKDPYAPNMALDYIHGGRDILFDGRIVDAMDRVIPMYPPGMDVTLSNGEVAVVVDHTNDVRRPIVRILDSGEDINLSRDSKYQDIFIARTNIVPPDFTGEVEKLNEYRQKVKEAKKKIIMVDDSSMSLMQAKAALPDEEFEITTYFTALDVIAAIREKGEPDLLIVDIDMPVMDGISMVNNLKKHDLITCPVIFLTSICNRETVLKCKSCGATDYILKPANHTYLYERVKIALGATQER